MRIKTLTSLVAAMFVVPMLALGPVANATTGTEGQIEGGNIYRTKNVTKSVDFADPANADACDVLRFKVRVHNPGPSFLSNVNVKALLPVGATNSVTSIVTLSSVNADPKSTSDTAVVNLSSSRSITYTSGTTQLLDTNGALVKGLPDGVTQGGINIGDQGVSINNIRYVQFDAKVECPQQPPCTPPNPDCTPPPVCTPPNPQCTPPVEPQVSTGVCKALEVTATNKGRNVSAKVTAEVNNATIMSYKIDWGDGAISTKQNDTHTYAKDGTYTIISHVQIKLANGSIVWKTAEACAKKVTFKDKENLPPVVTPPSTPTTPATVKELPVTGPAGVLAAFVGVSSLSTFLYSRFGRRFGL